MMRVTATTLTTEHGFHGIDPPQGWACLMTRTTDPWHGSPERSGSFLGEIRASRQHDLQGAKRAHIMAVELQVLLDAAKQPPEIDLAGARIQEYIPLI